MRRPTLVLRTEYGSGAGAGHLARCIALGAGWQERGGDAAIVGPPLPPPWDARVATAALEWRPVDRLPDAADWYVADGYTLPSQVREQMRERGRLLVIDDFGESGTIQADLVVDQNAGASVSDYPNQPALVGTRFVLLPRDSTEDRRRLDGDDVGVAVVGLGGFPSESVRSFAADVIERWSPSADVVVLDGTRDVHELLRVADLAFATAGSFCWELCRAGVPMVLFAQNRNQERLAAGLVAAGAAIEIGAPDGVNVHAAVDTLTALTDDGSARSSMARAGRSLVDGRGVARVVATLRAGIIDVRAVTADDAELLFEWRNDELTRAGSFDSAPISWDTHVAWLGDRLREPASMQWIGEFDGEPLGVVRFSARNDGRTEIGVTVAPDCRGNGWAAALIVAGRDRAVATGRVSTVVARIKRANIASVHAFDAADFAGQSVGEEAAIEMEWPVR